MHLDPKLMTLALQLQLPVSVWPRLSQPWAKQDIPEHTRHWKRRGWVSKAAASSSDCSAKAAQAAPHHALLQASGTTGA